MAFAIVAAVLAGAAALVAGEKILDAYQNDLFPPIKINPTVEEMSRLKAARLSTATLTFTCLGGFLGLAMGLAGGLARRSVPAGIRAAIIGFVLGTAAEGILTYCRRVDVFQAVRSACGRPGTPLAHPRHDLAGRGCHRRPGIRARAWRPGRWKSTLVGGLLGAAVATVVYEIGGALVFASSKTELPLSSSVTTRAIALLLVAIFSAAGGHGLRMLPCGRRYPRRYPLEAGSARPQKGHADLGDLWCSQ